MDSFEFRQRLKSGVDSATEALVPRVIGAVIEVHRQLGPGIPERSYLLSLSHELSLRGIGLECEVPLPILYKGVDVGLTRMDILVEGRLVSELKIIEKIAPVHHAQLLTYLRIAKLQLGLINFNVERAADHIHRVVNTR